MMKFEFLNFYCKIIFEGKKMLFKFSYIYKHCFGKVVILAKKNCH